MQYPRGLQVIFINTSTPLGRLVCRQHGIAHAAGRNDRKAQPGPGVGHVVKHQPAQQRGKGNLCVQIGGEHRGRRPLIGPYEHEVVIVDAERARLSAPETAEITAVPAATAVTSPVVAFTGLCMLISVNVIVVVFKQTTATVTTSEQVAQAPADEFSYTVATIYDFENNQP